ncbi:TetR/AcrR family transcriptional regulator [Kosakonia sacchari]|uniref:Transcriptional regulator, TetR family n=1 Tax=Kosakonia sacchari TaxID=1158459 RepID=A0A1G4YIL4_9ENTR|nr:TetR/AcrR family transcriptional regulator [Kosakonia sacchari]AHJ77214.1 TetR family transcriptional regulator [Kosakonia sacchari SP1]MDN2485840.1 TetR/AcrR family transcriptional regulator [Kosakonia sacchari]SCX53342.1 transcriptional regulator, TetR family [Kosakonia sacchari]
MARPKSEDKKLALLEAATEAIAQSGIAASTALIARNAGVAEGTLFRYFATKDDLLNALYLHLKSDLCGTMLANIDLSINDSRHHTQCIWNSYIDWGIRHPNGHCAVRQIAVSDKLTDATRQQVAEIFPELHELCHRSVRPVFLTDEYSPFGDAIFLSMADTTITFASRDASRITEFKRLGFEAMWRALAIEDINGQ